EPPGPPEAGGAGARGTRGLRATRTPVPPGHAVPVKPSKNIWNFTRVVLKHAGSVVSMRVANGTPGSPLVTRRILSAGSNDAWSARKSPQFIPARMQLSIAVCDEKSAETPVTTPVPRPPPPAIWLAVIGAAAAASTTFTV